MFGVVNKSTTVNRFVLRTLQRNITHLAVITRKTNIKLGILKGGTGKEPGAQIYCKRNKVAAPGQARTADIRIAHSVYKYGALTD